MAKTSEASPVVLTPGVPSPGLLSGLRKVGERLTDDQLVRAVGRAEADRKTFQASAIIAGVHLLAKRQTLPHGKWGGWVKTFANGMLAKLAAPLPNQPETGGGKLAAPLPISPSGDLAARSIRVYVQLAQQFLADLEQGAFAPDERDTPAPALQVAPSEVLSLETLPSDRRDAVLDRISAFVGGRSVRRMLLDFRRAEAAADAEEIEEQERGASRGKRASAGEPAQLDFWDEINRPLREISTLMTDANFVERTTREGWIKLSTELAAKAKEARAMAEKIK